MLGWRIGATQECAKEGGIVPPVTLGGRPLGTPAHVHQWGEFLLAALTVGAAIARTVYSPKRESQKNRPSKKSEPCAMNPSLPSRIRIC
jgi:hypothetical protein